MSKDNSDSKSFVSRWSRRKSSNPDIVRDAPRLTEDAVTKTTIPLNTITSDGSSGRMQTGVEADRIAAAAAKGNEPETVLTDQDMPDIDSLDENSDYTGFMSSGVSGRLRKLALRKLFAGDSFNIRDGLDDYDDDFTSFPPLGDIVTSDMKHRQEMEEKRRQEALAKEEEQRAAAEEEERLAQQDDNPDETLAEEKSQAGVQNQEPPDDDSGPNDTSRQVANESESAGRPDSGEPT